MQILTESFSRIGWPWHNHEKSKSEVLWQRIYLLESLYEIKQSCQRPLETLENPEKPWKKFRLEKSLKPTWNSLEIAKDSPWEKKLKLKLALNFSIQWGLTPEFLELLELHLIFLCAWNISEKQCFKLNVLEFFLDFQLLPKKYSCFLSMVSFALLGEYQSL